MLHNILNLVGVLALLGFYLVDCFGKLCVCFLSEIWHFKIAHIPKIFLTCVDMKYFIGSPEAPCSSTSLSFRKAYQNGHKSGQGKNT
jgi:hypothetical protein